VRVHACGPALGRTRRSRLSSLPSEFKASLGCKWIFLKKKKKKELKDFVTFSFKIYYSVEEDLIFGQAMVAHTCNPSTWEAEAGRSL
jgi:hypothetical protein